MKTWKMCMDFPDFSSKNHQDHSFFIKNHKDNYDIDHVLMKKSGNYMKKSRIFT